MNPNNDLQRSRLLTRADTKNLPRYILISAPSGYGKTMLAQQIVHHAGHPVIQHRVTRLQQDASYLHNESLRQFQELCPAIFDDIPIVPQTHPVDNANRLINYIEQYLPEPFIYVLDNVHSIEQSRGALSWLEQLIELWPSHAHLILVGHHLPEVGAVAIAAKGEAYYQAFQEDQLRFTPSETQTLAAQYDVDVNPRRLTSSFDGWPAGIAAKIKTLASGIADIQRSHIDPLTEFEHLARQLFKRQSDTIQQALLQTAVLPMFSAAYCEEALELPNMGGVIQEINRRNLFLYRLAEGYRYHDLFRDVLLRTLKEQDASAYKQLQAHVAAWQNAEGRFGESFWHYLEADDLDNAIATLVPHVHRYYHEGRWQVLIDANHAIIERGHYLPELHLVMSMLQLECGQVSVSQANVDRAKEGYQQLGDTQGLIKVDIQQACIWQRTERYDESVTLMNSVLRRDDLPYNLHGWALRIRSNSRAQLQDLLGAQADIQAADPYYKASGDHYSYASFLQDAAFVHNTCGDWDAAQAALARCVDVYKQLGQNPSGLTHAYNNLGYLYYLVSDYEQAEIYLDDGLQLSQAMSNSRGEAVLSWTFGDLKRDLGAYTRALRLYDVAVKKIGGLDKPMLHKILLNRARLAYWTGRWDHAYRDVNIILHEPEYADGLLYHIANLMQTVIAMTRGDLLPDDRLLLDQIPLIQDQYSTESTWVMGLCLYVSLTHNLYRVQEHLEQLLRKGMQVNTDHIYKRHQRYPHVVQSLAADIMNNENYIPDSTKRVLWQWYSAHSSDHRYGRLVEAVKRLQTHRVDNTSPQSLVIASPIKLLLLGDDTIMREGQRIPIKAWESAKARDLLAYMVMEQGNRDGFRQEDLIEALWPDASSDRQSSFTTTMNRTRKVVGYDVLPYDDQTKLYRINMDYVTSDAQMLIAQAKEARLNPPQIARTRDLWEQVLKQYQGDFLPKRTYSWAIKHRDECRHYYREAILVLADYVAACGDPNLALSYYQQGIEKLPEDEVLYRRIMVWYGQAGNRNRVQYYYNRLLRRLRKLFGEEATAQPETLDTYNSMMFYSP